MGKCASSRGFPNSSSGVQRPGAFDDNEAIRTRPGAKSRRLFLPEHTVSPERTRGRSRNDGKRYGRSGRTVGEAQTPAGDSAWVVTSLAGETSKAFGRTPASPPPIQPAPAGHLLGIDSTQLRIKEPAMEEQRQGLPERHRPRFPLTRAKSADSPPIARRPNRSKPALNRAEDYI